MVNLWHMGQKGHTEFSLGMPAIACQSLLQESQKDLGSNCSPHPLNVSEDIPPFTHPSFQQPNRSAFSLPYVGKGGMGHPWHLVLRRGMSLRLWGEGWTWHTV